ncbi:MAG TPA: Uma2 family endonuclease [Pyrinomonadaceae bacterium]|nr:Uma2 family endonuclease [Pyrinomonadaceae bacterium]
MSTIPKTKVWTDEELLALPKDGNKYEVMKGILTMSPAGFKHEYIGVRLIFALENFLRLHKLGVVLGSSLGCWMENRDFLSPDVSFIAKERLEGQKHPTDKFFDGAPDLAVEVLSPSERDRVRYDKLVDYFSNGSRLVWVINPKEKVVLVYRSPQDYHLLREADVISGETVIPGFTLPVSELFAEWNFD